LKVSRPAEANRAFWRDHHDFQAVAVSFFVARHKEAKMIGSMWLWIGFMVFVPAMLALDMGGFHRNAHEVRVREALVWSAVWLGLALAFNAAIFVFSGAAAGFEFLTGYLIEKSLSVDNIFVFLLIFSYFSVPARYQHKVLFWGVTGALA